MSIKFKVINGVKHYYGEVNGLCTPLTSQQLNRELEGEQAK